MPVDRSGSASKSSDENGTGRRPLALTTAKMNDYRSVSYSSCRSPGNSTSYHGAQGVIEDQYSTIRLDGEFDTKASAIASPTAASRWLSTLSNTTAPNVTAALARSSTILHSRARSLAANLNNPSNGASPEKNRQSKIFGDLFSGQSAPVHLGVPTSPQKEDETTEFFMEYQPKFTERPERPKALRHQRRESALSTRGVTTKATKTSWFNRKQNQPIVASVVASDEFVNMNINNELFPHGPADPLSPQAFNDLLLNATALLQRMQAAYREKVEYVSTIQPEIDAQKEEVEEAETRSAMLKSQLDNLGRQHEEQKEVNLELMEQLSVEKVKLSEWRERSRNTIKLVGPETEGGNISDDETRRRRKRGSAGSASDSGFESDADSASLWSAGLETPGVQRPTSFMLSLEHADPATARPRVNPPAYSSRASTISQQSAGYPPVAQGHRQLSAEGAAWATVERLRHENQGLQSRMDSMQHGLQDCIEMIEGGVRR